MMFSRSEIRHDLVEYHRALITNRLHIAAAIEKKYLLHGRPPQLVSIGLEAAADGRDYLALVEEHELEAPEEPQ